MSIDEMESREAFYGERMVWIVNAERFRSQITIHEALPNPEAEFVTDLLFVQPIPGPKTHNVIIRGDRSEEHTSELQSLMRISYAVFCLKKKKETQKHKS